jgi:transmembrane sensor
MGISPELLSRYHQGLCSEEEQKRVEDWLNGEWAEGAHDTEQIPPALKQQIGKRVWRQLNPAQRLSLQWPLGIAASITLAAVLSYLVFFQPHPRAHALSQQAVKTVKGQKTNVTLPDGTQVALNSDSEIKFPTVFADSLRKVFLSGEAFFTVTKDPAKPFVVQTLHSETRVLGTRFDLKAYPTEPSTMLVVEEGVVTFANRQRAGEMDTLVANQQIVLTGGVLQSKKEISASRVLAWRTNVLAFDDLPLAQIVAELERWYGVKIEIKTDALKEQRYTGRFTGASLASVLQSMAYAVNFRYDINDKSVTIYAYETR